MPDWPLLIGGTLLVAIASAFCIGGTLRPLRSRHILDRPNRRSSHSVAVPRGGGIGLLIVLIPVWLAAGLIAGQTTPAGWGIPVLALLLAIISWIDDVSDLAPAPRLLAQALAVAIGVYLLPGPTFQGVLPPILDPIITGLLWLWFVNLFNFMDGIDGISGVSALAMGLGVNLVLTLVTIDPPAALQALAVAAAALGFLVWNWHPARIFLGDVGSIPLGFLLGWLLLTVAAHGLWIAALIIPLYYLADAGLTLAKRLMRGANVFEAHREHFYQRAVQAGRSHAIVAAMVLATTLALVGHAVVVTLVGPIAGLPALISATALVGGLLVWMRLPVVRSR